MPQHGLFVEARLRHLVASGSVEARVVAPVPWCPPALGGIFARYSDMARVASKEVRGGIPVYHPRYAHLPKIGMNVQARLMAFGVAPTVRRLIGAGYDFDLIDAHYFYPDGVAASLLAKEFRKPFIVTARGSDINLVARYAVPRRMIRSAARNAAGLVAVSEALRDAMTSLDIPAQKIVVIRNGVDLQLFAPKNRERAREALGLVGPQVLLTVGNLVENKGHHLVVEALRDLPDCELVVVGEGEQRRSLGILAKELGVSERVRIVGRVPQTELPEFYSAADAVVLASSREGLPNVVLEALACGTPVVATRVGGIPEVVGSPEAGLLIDRRDSSCIAAGVKQVLAASPDRSATRRQAQPFSWESATAAQEALFDSVVRESRRTDSGQVVGGGPR